MPAQKLWFWTRIVTVMVVIDAMVRPLIFLGGWLAPGAFTTYVMPIATAVDGSVLGFKILTMIVFSRWIYVAGDNLFEAGMEELEFSPASRFWWFLVPVASLFKPFQGMRELWNASRNVWPYDTNAGLVSTWWGLWLATNFFAYISSATNRDSQNLITIYIHIAAEIAVAVAAIALVRGIAKGQAGLAGSNIAEVFA